ncbi:MAG: hypothetical protein ABSE68_03105 [Minisyncoccia bacterium]
MTKKIILIFSFLILLAPISGFAQTSEPSLPGQNLLNGVSAPVSSFIDNLKSVLANGLGSVGGNISTPTNGGSGVSLDLSSIGSVWDSINNWFSANIGVSFRDIVKVAANVLIWFWELLIKLIQVGVSKL